MLKKLIIDKNHIVLVLKFAHDRIFDRDLIHLNLFDKHGLSLMTLNSDDIVKLKRFLKEDKDEK